MWFSRSDIVYAAAQRQRLSRILPGASTSRNNPTVSPPKGHCKVVAAMIISRLYYCNSVLAGLPADNAARLVMKEKKQKKKRDQFTPLLKGLNGLPVKFHCQYKIATLAYRHFEESLPPYLYLSAPINHPGLSDLPKKSDSKSPSET